MVIAQAETLLVCLDFDGTLAELNPDPYAVTMHPAAEDAIRRLAALPGTEVAIPVSYTHLTLPTTARRCRSRWSPYH